MYQGVPCHQPQSTVQPVAANAGQDHGLVINITTPPVHLLLVVVEVMMLVMW